MLIANVAHTPLPDLFRMTWRQIAVFAAALPEVAKLTSPWPTGDGKKEEAISDPEQIRFLGRSLGFYGIGKAADGK